MKKKDILNKVLQFIAVSLSVMILSIVLPSCSAEEGIGLNRSEREYLSRKTEIVFVGEKNYPPFEFIQKNGSYGGMSIELLRWIATEAGFNIEFIPMEHGDMQRHVHEGKADAVVGLFESPERKKNFIMTIPYFIIPGSIFIKSERPDIKNAYDLQNKNIAVMVEDYAGEWLEQHNIRGKIIYTRDFRESVQSVIEGKADALIGDEQPVLFFLYSKGERSLLKKITPPLYEGRNCVAVSQNNPLLASILNKGIARAEKTGIIKRINDRWLGVPVDTENSFIDKHGFTILVVLASLLIVILISFFWILLLRREVARRTKDLELEITKLTETEKDLSDAVMRYRGIYDNTPDSIFWIREDNGSFFIENVNPAHKKNTGFGNETIAGRNIEDILPPDLAAPVLKNYRECISSGQVMSYEEQVPFHGEIKTFWTLLVPILDQNNSYSRLVGFSRDITTSKAIEMAVRHTQKLESLGILAGGIAHDFNNLLSAIMGNIDLTIHNYRKNIYQEKFLDSALIASRRAADLCAQLLAYSGKGIIEYRKISLNAVINEMLSILEVSVSKKTIFRISAGEKMPGINADPSQVRQVIMNLVINASESLGVSGGFVELTTGSGYFKKDELHTAWSGEHLKDGLFAWISVRDNGCGMNEDTMTHLFDPFFTTKFTGRGLGLSAILGIVRSHKGAILVKSSPGNGSEFRVYFPAEYSDELAEPGIPAAEIKPPAGELVMVVDDEDHVRDVIESMLGMLGYNIIKAVNGLDAIEKLTEVINKDNRHITFILLDLTMPHMDGSDTYRKLMDLSPESHIILMSGYSENDISEKFAGKGIAGFLQKPFILQDLKNIIASISRNN